MSAAALDELAPRGTVYGFEVHADRPLRSLRGGTGARLEVVEDAPAFTSPGPLIAHLRERHFETRIHQPEEDRFRLWVKHVGWFGIDAAAGRISTPAYENAVVLEEILWGVPALVCFLHRGDLSLHAAAVEVDGRALLLTAPRAHGKSTLAAAFAARGHRILSEDLSCIGLDPVPSVVPGPATIRLRNDVGAALSVPRTSVLPGARDRVRLALAPEARGTCAPVPIAGLLFLRPSDGEVALEPIAPARTLPDLWRFSFRLTAAHRAGCFERIADLAASVPMWNLRRPLTLEALEPTVDAVLERLG
jgi:hypothetical protein